MGPQRWEVASGSAELFRTRPKPVQAVNHEVQAAVSDKPKRRWYQFGLKIVLGITVLLAITLVSLWMTLAHYASQVPSVVLQGKLGAECRIYPDWRCKGGRMSVYCDLRMGGKAVVYKARIDEIECGQPFHDVFYTLRESGDGKTIVVFSKGASATDVPVPLFAYTDGVGVVKSYDAGDLNDESRMIIARYESETPEPSP